MGTHLPDVVPKLSGPPSGGPFRPKRAMRPGRNRLAPGRGAAPQPAPEMVADRNFANVTGGGGMSSTESGMISTGQDLWLIGPNDLAVEITSGLHYSSTDPYAVKISLDVDVDREVVWTVSRDLHEAV